MYVIDVEGKELKKVKNAHNKIVNFDDNTQDIRWLDTYLSDKKEISIENPINTKNIDLVVITGWC